MEYNYFNKMDKCTVFYCILPYMYLIYKNNYYITITSKFNDDDLLKKINDGEVFGFIKLDATNPIYILLHYTDGILINDFTIFDLFKITDNENFNIISLISCTPLAQFPDVFSIIQSKFDVVYIKKYPKLDSNLAYFESEYEFYNFLDYFFIKTYKCLRVNTCIRVYYNIDIEIDNLFYFIKNKTIFIVGENMLGTYRRGPFNIKTQDELNSLFEGEDISNYTSNIAYQSEIIFIDIYPLSK